MTIIYVNSRAMLCGALDFLMKAILPKRGGAFAPQGEEPKEKGGNPGVVLALVLFALLGGGAAFCYFKFLKPKQNVKGDTDLEDFDFEDYDEDEPEADTGEVSKEEETEDEEV